MLLKATSIITILLRQYVDLALVKENSKQETPSHVHVGNIFQLLKFKGPSCKSLPYCAGVVCVVCGLCCRRLLPLWGSSKAKWFWVRGHTKSNSKKPLWGKDTRDTPLRQAWGGSSRETPWYLGLSPWGPAGHSTMRRLESALLWFQHLQVAPQGSAAISSQGPWQSSPVLLKLDLGMSPL